MRSASRFNRRALPGPEVFRHGPCSKAARAAFTAISTSAASASATWQISSPVVGLMVAKVLPDWLFTQRLLMRSLVADTAALFSEGEDNTDAMSLLLCWADTPPHED